MRRCGAYTQQGPKMSSIGRWRISSMSSMVSTLTVRLAYRARIVRTLRCSLRRCRDGPRSRGRLDLPSSVAQSVNMPLVQVDSAAPPSPCYPRVPLPLALPAFASFASHALLVVAKLSCSSSTVAARCSATPCYPRVPCPAPAPPSPCYPHVLSPCPPLPPSPLAHCRWSRS